MRQSPNLHRRLQMLQKIYHWRDQQTEVATEPHENVLEVRKDIMEQTKMLRHLSLVHFILMMQMRIAESHAANQRNKGFVLC